MRAFEFVAAKDSSHAVALLAEHAPSAKVLAGGTDLLADLKFSSHIPGVVVDITRAEDLRGITETDEGLSIGTLVTHTEIMASPIIREMFPALVDAAHTIGAVQTRNLGTLGGNLVTAVPSVDSGPTLVALDALVTLLGPAGRRQMPLADFFVGPRKTALAPDELLVEILIPKESLGKPTHFLKFGLRKGQALALVSENRREALLLHHIWGFTFREIGDMLGITERAAKLRAFRGIQTLREVLGADMPNQGQSANA